MKKVTLNLVGLDGNAFALLGAFKSQARKENWTKEEINDVINEAMNGDYDHLLCALSDHCTSIEEDEDDFDEDDGPAVCDKCLCYLNDDEDGPLCDDCAEQKDWKV